MLLAALRTLFELAVQPLHPGALLILLLAGMVATALVVVPRFPRAGLLAIGGRDAEGARGRGTGCAKAI
jgi:hypothetical protein